MWRERDELSQFSRRGKLTFTGTGVATGVSVVTGVSTASETGAEASVAALSVLVVSLSRFDTESVVGFEDFT